MLLEHERVGMAEDQTADTREFESMEEIEEALMQMNEDVTSDGLDEVVLQGRLGYHIFADNDADSALSAFQKQMHIAFDQAIQELFVDEDIVRDYHAEVTPQTICATVEDQMDDFYGHGGLDEAFLHALGQQMGAEADVMSAGKMFSDDNPAEVF
jgi:hypothetical protein